MKDLHIYDKIICEKYSNIPKIVDPSSVDLSIVFPPLKNTKNHLKFFRSILEDLAAVTKPGGICCFFTGGEIDSKTGLLSMAATMAILEISSLKNNWTFNDKIIWEKRSEEEARSEINSDSSEMVDFRDTEFMTIHILVREGSEFESIDFREKVETMPISQAKKEQIADDFWHIPSSSDKEFNDMIPIELAIRLITLFSEEGELVLDPFCGNGMIAKASKNLKRHFLCFDENELNCKIASKRIEK